MYFLSSSKRGDKNEKYDRTEDGVPYHWSQGPETALQAGLSDTASSSAHQGL